MARRDHDQVAASDVGPAVPVLRRRGRGGPLPRWLRAALVALLVAAVASGAVLAVQQRRQDERAGAAQQALAAARSAAAVVLSYDYRHLDDDFSAAQALTAQPFTGEYQRTTAKAVRPLATKNKAVVTARVQAAGVVRVGADRVTVLAFVDQTTRSSRLERPQLDQSRVELTMVRGPDGRWLVGGVKAM